MAYDEDLADRVRELLAEEPALSEGRMFGGLAFLLEGNMAVCVSGQGGLMIRVRPDDTAGVLATTVATPMVMQGREVRGWVRVATADVPTKRHLRTWVRRGVDVAASLPPKRRKGG